MPQIYITIKSFEWCHVKNTIMFITKIQFLVNSIYQHKLENLNEISFPKKSKLFTVLRSPHIDKKSREQFQLMYYKQKVFIKNESITSAALFIFLLKNSEFPGVEIEISLFYKSLLIN